MATATETVEVLFQGTDNVTPAVQSIDASVSKVGESATNAATSLSTATGKMAESFEGASDGAAKTSESVSEMAKEVKDLDGKPVESVLNLNKAMVALGAAAGAALVAGFLKTADAIDSFNKQLQFAGEGSIDAAAEFEYVQTVADRFGIAVLEAAENYGDFLSATVGSGADAGQLRAIFEAVSGSIQAIGGSSKEAAKTFGAFADAISDGEVSFSDLEKITSQLPGGLQGFADALDLPVESLSELAKNSEIGVQELIKYADALETRLTPDLFDGVGEASNRLSNAFVDLFANLADSGAIDVFIKGIELVTLAVTGAFASIGLLGETVAILWDALYDLDFSDFGKQFSDALDRGAEKTRGAYEAFRDLEEPVRRVAQAVEEVSNAGGDVGTLIDLTPIVEEMERAEKAAEKTELQLLKLASNEKIAFIEAKVELDVAQLEADAKRAVALIEAVGDSVTSARDLLGSLFGELGEADNFRDRFAIEDQIELENERLEKSLELQEKQVNAQLRLAKLRENALRNGDTTITVNGDGLQPHLEAFMWEILEAVQVRVNAQGLDMLLGAP